MKLLLLVFVAATVAFSVSYPPLHSPGVVLIQKRGPGTLIHPRPTTQTLYALKESDSELPTKAPLNISIPYSALYVSLLLFAFVVAPGEPNSAADQALLSELISNPSHPDVNQIWFTIWNFFAVVPLVLSAMVLPGPPTATAEGGFHKASPFLLGSAFLGFFALGPFMITRPPASPTPSTPGFFTRNVFENKIFSAALLLLSGVVTTQLPLSTFSSSLDSFASLLTTSRFVSVACFDLAILTSLCSILIPEDAARRNTPTPTPLPFIPLFGPILWLLTRPPLPTHDDN